MYLTSFIFVYCALAEGMIKTTSMNIMSMNTGEIMKHLLKATTDQDVKRSLEAMIRVAAEIRKD